MKLATLKAGGRDGTLVVVSRDLARCRAVPAIARTLQAALDNWGEVEPQLRQVYEALNSGALESETFDAAECHSPLPRAYQWADGSAYINHVELVRKARNAEVPASFYTDPLMYQGGSDSFVGPRDTVVADPAWGIDFEAEVAVVTGDVPMGATPEQAAAAIRLVMLVNDVSLRNLIPGELAKGFGFFQSKPASAFSPVAVTPDELGDAWRGAKVHLPLLVELNGKPFGKPNAGVDMTFDFGQLVAHVARTRELEAGSIIGSGTVSNKQGGLWGSSIDNGGVGYCCLAEVRMYETIEQGKPVTPFMQPGDRVRIEMKDAAGNSIFGVIDNTVALPKGA
ncbi:MAG: fumarylacetoacetate hydrolase family protein [Rhodocyclaceae bacterium]|nr:fumarylacetoacetate hydrolase family protein [Rhodocyclaceae bacterium]MCP5232632.1 fumarylacetoacetate hydrolase family protein [Zoogloeaceae bacterium]MCP5240674.1 fumarylacetoacetate hydrolase family protein [Zoogloeaceae bacterium]MCP5253214.1 fumarylacetoacetate hydrolase family protein [Zoogloeaceae bacterium]MCP5293472.1 fumarylacetoacetate hydrolase family protein [Zoogloeaceae bacterium]